MSLLGSSLKLGIAVPVTPSVNVRTRSSCVGGLLEVVDLNLYIPWR
jgi:hypothetical protein